MDQGEQLPATASTVRYPAHGNAPWLPTVEPKISPVDEAVLVAGRRRMALLWSCLGSGPSPEWPSLCQADRSFEQAV